MVVAGGGKTRVVEQPAAGPEGVNLDAAIGGGHLGHGAAAASGAPGRRDRASRGYSGGRWSGGGDVDPLTLLLAVAMLPLAWRLRRSRPA